MTPIPIPTDLPPLPKGMTVTPYMWGDELMMGAWAGFVHFAVGESGMTEAFEMATGKSITQSMRPRSGIEMMVDQATGHDAKAELMGAFLDWATTNHWGVYGQEFPEEDES